MISLATIRAVALPRAAVMWLLAVGTAVIGGWLLGRTGVLIARSYLVGATGLVGLALLRGPGWRMAWRGWLWGLTVGALWATAMFGLQTDAVWLRSIGNDPLTYESFARDVLATWSLQGGEPVFYYQPLFRYIRFLERLAFGDGEALIIAFAFGMFHVALLVFIGQAFRRIRTRPSDQRSRHAIAGVTAALVMVLAATTLPMFGWPASEYPTWIMLPGALLAFQSRTLTGWALGGLLLGFSAITRVNQILGHAAVLLTRRPAGARPGTRARVVAAATFCAVLLLPLAHNLWFGGQAVPFTTSTSIPQNLNLPPERLLKDWDNVDTRATLMRQVEALLYRMPYDGRTTIQVVVYHSVLVIWLTAAATAVFLAFRRKHSLARVAALVSPLAFGGVHIFYQVTTYYPRHIVVWYLAMGLLTIEEMATRPSPRRPIRGCAGGEGMMMDSRHAGASSRVADSR